MSIQEKGDLQNRPSTNSWQHSIKLTKKTKELSKSLQNTEFRWITEKEVRYAHDWQINKYGGNPGPPGKGALEAALFRPKNHCYYSEPKPTIFELAAYYVWGIVNNHPFADGNKRTALAVALAFLSLNGYKAEPEDDEALEKMRATASFEVRETELAEWLEKISFPKST